MRQQVPHPKAPTLDCIIPLSAPDSPGFVPANVQAAHFDCNWRKSANITAPVQLRIT
jgi:hypothetical protein